MTVSELIEELRAMPPRCARHAVESDGRSSPPQSTKGRAFHDEIRPNSSGSSITTHYGAEY
jgi:hypothetical protein